MKWIVRVIGFIGVAWGALSTLYALAVLLLAPLAVHIDSADFRNALIWVIGALLFYMPFLFTYIVHLILKKQRFRRAALIASIIGLAILIYGITLVEVLPNGVILLYVVPLIGWLITMLYVNWPQKNIELTLG